MLHDYLNKETLWCILVTEWINYTHQISQGIKDYKTNIISLINNHIVYFIGVECFQKNK